MTTNGLAYPPTKEETNMNDADVVEVLTEAGKPLTRPEIAKRAPAARTTVYDALVRLIRQGKVSSYSNPRHRGRGRPKVFYKLN